MGGRVGRPPARQRNRERDLPHRLDASRRGSRSMLAIRLDADGIAAAGGIRARRTRRLHPVRRPSPGGVRTARRGLPAAVVGADLGGWRDRDAGWPRRLGRLRGRSRRHSSAPLRRPTRADAPFAAPGRGRRPARAGRMGATLHPRERATTSTPIATHRAVGAAARAAPRRRRRHGPRRPDPREPAGARHDRLVGVLDGGGFGPADPALELVVRVAPLRRRRPASLRATLDVDDVQWARGAAWAFVQAMGLGWYYRAVESGDERARAAARSGGSRRMPRSRRYAHGR